jgi:hypothetical protein
MLVTEPSADAGAPHVTPRDAGDQSQRSFTAVSGPRDVRRLTTELRRHERRHAIVVVSLADGSQQSVFPYGGIWTELAQPVPIYLLSTPYICRRFAEAVGSGLACRHGAARIYWPEVTAGELKLRLGATQITVTRASAPKPRLEVSLGLKILDCFCSQRRTLTTREISELLDAPEGEYTAAPTVLRNSASWRPAVRVEQARGH